MPTKTEAATVDMVKCDWSGEKVPASETFEAFNGVTGELMTISRSFLSDFVTCAHDGKLVPSSQTRLIHNGERVAELYVRNGTYFPCDGNGDLYLRSEMYEYDDSLYCEAEYDEIVERNERRELIREYDDHDYPAPIGTDELKAGVELEVEVINDDDRYDLAQAALDKLGEDFVILKNDGSLENGFEIVSAPADFSVHYTRWDRFFANRPRNLRSWDAPDDSCGMHVHVSRSALSALQLGKILVFINDPDNVAFVERMAGRSSSDYAKFKKKKLSDGGRERADEEKYMAVNTLHKKTIEFRIFKGTLNIERFKGNLEFVEAVCKFSSPATGSAANLTKEAFVEYVRPRRKLYPHLYNRLVRFNMLPAPKVAPGKARQPAETVLDNRS